MSARIDPVHLRSLTFPFRYVCISDPLDTTSWQFVVGYELTRCQYVWDTRQHWCDSHQLAQGIDLRPLTPTVHMSPAWVSSPSRVSPDPSSCTPDSLPAQGHPRGMIRTGWLPRILSSQLRALDSLFGRLCYEPRLICTLSR